MKKIAYPGTFDPFHLGHKHVVDTLAKMFDEVHIIIFDNIAKKTSHDTKKRQQAIANIFKKQNVIVHSSKDSLENELAKQKIEFVGRGIRNDQDLNIELQRAAMLNQISGIETIFIPTSKDYVFISSSIIRELIYLQKDISNFVPQEIISLYTKENK